MAKSPAQRVRVLEQILTQMQEQRYAAVHAIARERVLRQALEELDPQPEDDHREYGALVQRLYEVLKKEREQLVEELLRK